MPNPLPEYRKRGPTQNANHIKAIRTGETPCYKSVRHPDTIRRVRWFVHPSLTPAVAEALVRHGHTVVPLAEADIDEIHLAQLDVITAENELIDSVMAGAKFKRSIVHLTVGPGDVEQDDAVDRLFKRYKRLSPGRLYTVSTTRVKIRQLPTNAVAQRDLI